jgi:pimeloyl-ACP methyl ester carboxylesterase
VKRRRVLSVVVGLLVFGLAVLFLWPEVPPHPSGAWMARAGVTPRQVVVGGQRLRYVRRGSGPPVVLVHGFASSIYTWSEVIPRLAKGHDVIAVDLPGFGGSDVPDHFDPEAWSSLLAGLLDALDVPRASLAGNSLGGALCAVTAARWPERVERLVLLDAAGYNLALERRPWLLRVMGKAPGGLLDALPQRPLMRQGLRQVFHDDGKVTSERVEEYLAPMARPGARAASRRLLTSGATFGLPELVKRVKAPTLVIWGAHDTWIPPADADLFVRDLPGARKVVIEACGHVPQEEKPEEVARLMDEFIGYARRE